MIKGKIRIALVGAGGWGMQHARILSGRDDIDFCAIAGRTEERTKKRAEKFGVRYYLDIGEMLEKEHPDFVNMCLPNKGHFEATLQVIRAGVPLLVEKPLVFDLTEADILLNEAEKRNLFFAVNFNQRYAVPVQMAKQVIADGRLGDIAFVLWRFGGGGGACPEHENLIETQCHGFDMLEYLCGPITSIAAQMTESDEMKFSTMALSLGFVNGAVGALVGSYNTSPVYNNTQYLEINGMDARVLVEDNVRRFSLQTKHSETREVWEAGFFNEPDKVFQRTFDKHFDQVIMAFKEGKKPPVHARAGRRALALAHAAIDAFTEKRTIQVDPVMNGKEMETCSINS